MKNTFTQIFAVLFVTVIIMVALTACNTTRIVDDTPEDDTTTTEYKQTTGTNVTTAEPLITTEPPVDPPADTVEPDETAADSQSDESVPTDDIVEIINKNLDIIMEDNPSSIDERLIEKHPNEFAEIIALGETALPFLDEIIKNYDDSRAMIAMVAKFTIKPELYDIVFPSPDGKYAVKASVYQFLYSMPNDYQNIRIIESATGEIICNSNIIAKIERGVEWSPDNRYAAVMYEYNFRYANDIFIFDTVNANYIILPDVEELKPLILIDNQHFAHWDFLYAYSFTFGNWIEENKIKIGMGLRFGGVTFGETVSGWYIYDLIERKIIDIDFKIESSDTVEPAETAADSQSNESMLSDDIAKIINNNFDIILADDPSLVDEELIEKHNNEFAEMSLNMEPCKCQ